jgi:hypothetical protein
VSRFVQAFLDRGYNVVASLRSMAKARRASSTLVLVDGDMSDAGTGEKVAKTAITQFGSAAYRVPPPGGAEAA